MWLLSFLWHVSVRFREIAKLDDGKVSALNGFADKLFCAGQVKDHVHHGAELLSFASMRVQLQGGRIIVSAKLEDVWSHLKQITDEESGRMGIQYMNFALLFFLVW